MLYRRQTLSWQSMIRHSNQITQQNCTRRQEMDVLACVKPARTHVPATLPDYERLQSGTPLEFRYHPSWTTIGTHRLYKEYFLEDSAHTHMALRALMAPWLDNTMDITCMQWWLHQFANPHLGQLPSHKSHRRSQKTFTGIEFYM